MSQPKLLDTPLYALLHKDDITGFNKERPQDGPIDMVGGTSMGAVIAAAAGMGFGWKQILEVSRDGWQQRKPHNFVLLQI